MPTKHGSDLDYHMPLVLADQTTDEQGIGEADYQGALTSPRGFKAGILMAIAAASGIAALSISDPVTLVASVTASLVGNSAPQLGVEPSAPAIQPAADAPALTQSVADAQDLLPPAKDAPKSDLTSDPKSDPKSDEVAASEPAAGQVQTETSRDQTEKAEPPPDALFRQFQAWAADQDAQANVKPAQPVEEAPAQVVQNAPAQVVENARVPHRLAQRHRHAPSVHNERNSRAEMRSQNFRKQVRQAQSARVERPPIQDARAQEQPAQNTQAPSFLSGFGQRN